MRVFRSQEGPGPRLTRCPRAGRRALVVVRGAAAAGRALRASPRPARRRRAARAALRPRRGRCAAGPAVCVRDLRERARQHHRAAASARAATATARSGARRAPGPRPTRVHRSVLTDTYLDATCATVPDGFSNYKST